MQKRQDIKFDSTRIEMLSDKELVRAILLRDEYKEEARGKIISEATKRGIISSHEDLQKSEYQLPMNGPQSFFRFSMITSVDDAQHIVNSLYKYFYMISIGFGGIGGLFKVHYLIGSMWSFLWMMLVCLILSAGFHIKRSFVLSLAFCGLSIFGIAYSSYIVLSGISNIGILGILLNFILLYFAAEVCFATKYLKKQNQTGKF